MSAFSWTPQVNAKLKPRVFKNKIQFGDGYSQEQLIGMNPIAEDWSLVFPNLIQSDSDAIWAYLTAAEGTSFDWQPPGAVSTKKFRCSADERDKTVSKGSLYTITATFRMVFEP